MRSVAIWLENELAEKYVGHEVLNAIRPVLSQKHNNQYREIWDMLNSFVLQFIAQHANDYLSNALTERVIWQFASSLINAINNFKVLYMLWNSEMGDKLDIKPFKNTRHGGFFF